MGPLNPGESTATDGTSDEALVEVFLDEIAIGTLSEDVEIMGDASLEVALRRRLDEGLRYLRVVGIDDIHWRPILRDTYSIGHALAQADIGTLHDVADASGYGKDVLIISLLASPICEPLEIALHRRCTRPDPPMTFRELRRVPGKGNIYPISLEIPGYQIVFMKMLAGPHRDKELAIEAGLLALAKEVISGTSPADLEVTAESYAFARRMVTFARSSRASL